MEEATAPVDEVDLADGYEMGDPPADRRSPSVIVYLDASPSWGEDGPWVADTVRYEVRGGADDAQVETGEAGQIICHQTTVVARGGHKRVRCWQSEDEYVEVAYGDVEDVEFLSAVRERRLEESVVADVSLSPEGLSVSLHRVSDEWELVDEYWRTWAEVEKLKSDNYNALLVDP